MKFKGVPYPIVKDPNGYMPIQGGVRQIKSDLLALILTNPGERCLTGDTKIPLANGTEIEIKDLVGKDPFWVYSYDHKSDAIVPGKATAYKTLENAELMEVVLDDDGKVRCTPDHLWMLRDGSYRRADELRDDNLMSFGENHKVKEIVKLTEREDCYDLRVEEYHNFALSAGVFVHNCMLPEYGTPLRTLLFEPNDINLQSVAREMIIDSIRKWEPRISLEQITVTSKIDDKSINIADDKTETGSILIIRILFLDPENIQTVQELKLEVPLGGNA